MIFSCIDPRSNDLWSISILAVLDTEGFARDAKIAKNHAFVAAGQSGIQIWDLDSKNRVSNFTGSVHFSKRPIPLISEAILTCENALTVS